MRKFLLVIFAIIYQCVVIGALVLSIIFGIGILTTDYCTDVFVEIGFGCIILCAIAEIVYKGQELFELVKKRP